MLPAPEEGTAYRGQSEKNPCPRGFFRGHLHSGDDYTDIGLFIQRHNDLRYLTDTAGIRRHLRTEMKTGRLTRKVLSEEHLYIS